MAQGVGATLPLTAEVVDELIAYMHVYICGVDTYIYIYICVCVCVCVHLCVNYTW